MDALRLPDLVLTLTNFICLDQSDDIRVFGFNVEDDEPYALVFAVDLKTIPTVQILIPVGASNSKMTLVGPLRDGNPLICRALVRLLKDASDVEVVATATDALVTLALAEKFRPAVVLLDAGTARLDGMLLTRSLRLQAPAIQVVMLSVYATMRDPSLTAGACRFPVSVCLSVRPRPSQMVGP